MSTSDRITAYLASGGLFNPELANHDAVRDLLIDARKRIDELEDVAAQVSSFLVGYGQPAEIAAEKLREVWLREDSVPSQNHSV